MNPMLDFLFYLKYEMYPSLCERWEAMWYPQRYARMKRQKEQWINDLCARLEEKCSVSEET